MLAALLGLGLAGCSLTPTYVRPSVLVPATFGAPTATGSPAPDVQRIELTEQERNFAHTLAPGADLEAVLQAGLAHNADYRIAALTVERARAELRIQRASRVPQVDLTAQAQRQQFDDEALNARYQQDLKTVGVGIGNFEVDLFGRVKAMSTAARERFLASEHGHEALRGAILAEIARAYVEEQTAAADQTQAGELNEVAQALLKIMAARQHVGVAAVDEVNAARAAADQAQVAWQQATDRQRAALRALQILVGYDVVPQRIAMSELAAATQAPAFLRNLDSTILLTRPDVRQAESELRAANADIGAARAAFFPSISLSTSIGTASESLDGLFDSGSRSWSFMPQLSLPIFDLGRRRANLDLAHLRKRTEIIEYERAIQSAFRDVADALDAMQTTTSAQARSAQKAHDSQQRAARAQLRAEQGLQEPSLSLDARAEAVRATQSDLTAIGDRARAHIALFAALYGVELAPPAAAPAVAHHP
ncbi:hypothetical protein ASD72_18835 [Pseudoxanthomonas sp. Root630]|nr:hypothetical protein ASD72_18835 [Pseudoxanthomonas sp. Root630]